VLDLDFPITAVSAVFAFRKLAEAGSFSLRSNGTGGTPGIRESVETGQLNCQFIYCYPRSEGVWKSGKNHFMAPAR
jgi:hypothetical protein